MEDIILMYKMHRPAAERFCRFLTTEAGIPAANIHFDEERARTEYTPNYNGRELKMYKEYWEGQIYNDECFVMARIPMCCHGEWEDAMTYYGKKNPSLEYVESMHIGTCDGSFSTIGYVVGTKYKWSFSVKADYYGETTPDLRETTSDGNTRSFTYSSDGADDTKILFFTDEEGSHLECSYESEDPDCGTETIYMNTSSTETLVSMAKEQMDEITCFLDATNNGLLRNIEAPEAFIYNDFNNSTLYAVEKALYALLQEEKAV